MKKEYKTGTDALANVSNNLRILGESLNPVDQMLSCNDTTRAFGLVLPPDGALELAGSRADALAKTGRVEFGEYAVRKIILEFCDSPYLTQDTYAETLGELTQIFYYFKNELEWMSDGELIGRMKKYFDTVCRGSIGHLNLVLESMVHDMRYGCWDEAGLLPETDVFLREDADE
jgi:hypothetical protein